MNYETFRDYNNSHKIAGKVRHRVVSVDFKAGVCTVSVGRRLMEMQIVTVIHQVMQGVYCLSNPSIFASYNFSLLESAEGIRSRLLSEHYLLFHGSDGGIKGAISTTRNKSENDFGHGFYTGENLLQAENRVANVKTGSGIVYAYRYSLGSVKTYVFKDLTLWALYIGYCRGRLQTEIPAKLMTLLSSIDSCDVIIGLIADDKISSVYDAFLNNYITDKCLYECLRLVQYGRQFVFKTDVSLKCLSEVASYTLTKEMKKASIAWGHGVKKDMESNLMRLQDKYSREGLFMREVLRKYDI